MCVAVTKSSLGAPGFDAGFDDIHYGIGHRLGGVGPEFWLTIVFTGDPDLV